MVCRGRSLTHRSCARSWSSDDHPCECLSDEHGDREGASESCKSCRRPTSCHRATSHRVPFGQGLFVLRRVSQLRLVTAPDCFETASSAGWNTIKTFGSPNNLKGHLVFSRLDRPASTGSLRSQTRPVPSASVTRSGPPRDLTTSWAPFGRSITVTEAARQGDRTSRLPQTGRSQAKKARRVRQLRQNSTATTESPPDGAAASPVDYTEWLSTADVARICGLELSTIWHYVSVRSMPEPTRIGRTLLWRRDVIEPWASARRPPGRPRKSPD